MEPQICVIVPVYKVEKYIHRCVDSILAQTFRDFELVLVDDGSPDSCGAICDAYAAKDSRIHVIHRQNGGLSAARNSGIDWVLAHSGSRYITFIDSDDWVHPQFLKILMQAAADTDCGVCVCNHEYVNTYEEEKMTPLTTFVKAEVLTAEELLVEHEWNFNYACVKLYKKECFAEIRYPEGKIFEDTFTTYRILFAQKSIAFVNQSLYFYFRNLEGITRSPWTTRELGIFDAMRQQMKFYSLNGYPHAFAKEEKLYVHHHAYQLIRIRENRADWKKNKPIWRKIRRKMLALMKASGGKYTFQTMPYCFEAAFPYAAGVKALAGRVANAWKRYGFRGILKKIKEKLGE